MALPMVAFCCMFVTATEEQPAVDLEEQVGPVKESTHTHLHVSLLPSEAANAWPPLSQVSFAAHLDKVAACVLVLADREEEAGLFSLLGRTISTTGMTVAAAISRSKSTTKVVNSQSGTPQQRRCLRLRVRDPLSLSLGNGADSRRLDQLARLRFSCPVGVGIPGGGKDASMLLMLALLRLYFSRFPELLLWLWPPSLPLAGPSQPSMPSLLAVRPRSRFDASRVARLIKSERLLNEPRASSSLTTSTSMRAGLFLPTRCPDKPVVGDLRVSLSALGSPPRPSFSGSSIIISFDWGS
jgi:hypothetical protein